MIVCNAKNTYKYYVYITLLISFLFYCTYLLNTYLKVIPISILLYIYYEVIFIPDCDIVTYEKKVYISKPIKKYKVIKEKGKNKTVIVESNDDNFKPYYMSFPYSYDELPVDMNRIYIKIVLLLIFFICCLYK